MSHKTKKRPAHTRRSNESFQKRYGMKKSEWAKLKKELRKDGKGNEIAVLTKKARVR